MVIPPNDNNTEKYFKSMHDINKSLSLENLVWACPQIIWKLLNKVRTCRIDLLFFGVDLNC